MGAHDSQHPALQAAVEKHPAPLAELAPEPPRTRRMTRESAKVELRYLPHYVIVLVVRRRNSPSGFAHARNKCPRDLSL